jgi:hypothetical protein
MSTALELPWWAKLFGVTATVVDEGAGEAVLVVGTIAGAFIAKAAPPAAEGRRFADCGAGRARRRLTRGHRTTPRSVPAPGGSSC